MSDNIRPARVVTPGQIIQDELDARGWSQHDLAEIMSRPSQMVNEIIQAKKQITAETALQLAFAFGTSPDFWLNLEMQYQLFLAAKEQNETDISRRSALYDLAPVSELVKRGWISPVHSTKELETEICQYLHIPSIREQPAAVASYRISQERGPEQRAKIAWIRRVEQLAAAQPIQPFNPTQMPEFIQKLLEFTVHAEQTACIPQLFLDHGIHFVIVPHLSKTYLDGAALWIGEHPVVALSLRCDRIDAFWFTLLHELAHLMSPNFQPHLDQLYDHESLKYREEENQVNQQAGEWLVASNDLNVFIESHRPRYSKAALDAFAEKQKRHPGIVIGRLMHLHEIEYTHMRKYLVRVSPYLEHWLDVSLPHPSNT